MPKVKALNRNGEITWCTAKVPGHGNCNHVFHKTKDVSDEQFQQEVDNYNEKMTRLVHSGNVKWRLEAALAGYGLERLVYDKNPEVRAAVASQGYGLDKLINDKHPFVRIHVAKQNYGLDKLINDENAAVRTTVAEQGYGADFLANNTTPVRESVARQGYSLDALLEDTPIRDKNIDELGNHNNVESDTKTDKKDDLESLSTDELASLLRGEMNDLDISLKQDIPELNKSLDINNYRPKE